MSNRTFNEEAYNGRKSFVEKSIDERAAFMQRHCGRFSLAMTRLREEIKSSGWLSETTDSRRHRTQKHAVLSALRNVSEEAKHLDKFLAFDLLDADGLYGLVGPNGLVGSSGTIVQMTSKLGHIDYSEVRDFDLREAVDWLLDPDRFALLAGINARGKPLSGPIEEDYQIEEFPKELLKDDVTYIMSALLLLDKTANLHAWRFGWGNHNGILQTTYSPEQIAMCKPPEPSRIGCPGFTFEEKMYFQPHQGNGEIIESDELLKLGTFTLRSFNLGGGYHCITGRVWGRGNYVVLQKGQCKLRYHNIHDFAGEPDHKVANIVLKHPATVHLMKTAAGSTFCTPSPEDECGVTEHQDSHGIIIRCWLTCGGTRADICFRQQESGEPVIVGTIQTSRPFAHIDEPTLKNEPPHMLSEDDPSFAFSNMASFMKSFSMQLKEYQ